MQGGRLFHQLFLNSYVAVTGDKYRKNEENVEKLHREKKRKKIAYTRYL